MGVLGDLLAYAGEITQTQAVTSAACAYLCYYFYRVVHRPQFIASEGRFKQHLDQHLHVLSEHIWPTFWAFGNHLQTIGRVLFKSKPFIPYRRETLDTPDDGHISLDWTDNDENNTVYPDRQTRPTIIVMPGITGCRDASYVRHIVKEAEQLGCRCLVFNNRGLGETSLKTPRLFCACNAEDLEHVLAHVTKILPQSPIVMFAVSLGGVLLTNYLSRHERARSSAAAKNVVGAFVMSVPWDSRHTTASLEQPINWLLYNRFLVHKLKGVIQKIILTNYMATVGKPRANVIGACVVSIVWDPFKSFVSLEKPVNRALYNRYITQSLRNIIQRNWHVFQENIAKLPYKLEDVMKSTTIREFDDAFTSKSFGYPSYEQYYNDSSLTQKPLSNIAVPMLFLNAKDDPFAPAESIPIDAIRENPNMAMILTDYGGHIGFVEGPTIRGRSYVERLFNQFAQCVLHMHESSRN